MDLIIGLLTFVLVLTCLLLVLLILVQLPKKEAGAGVAFGGAATDALFGSGAGTVLSKLTRHTTIFFLCLAFGLSLLQAYSAKQRRNSIMERLDAQANAPAAPATTTTPATVPSQSPDLGLSNTVQAATTVATNAAAAAATVVATNAPAAPATNVAIPAPEAPATPAPETPAAPATGGQQ